MLDDLQELSEAAAAYRAAAAAAGLAWPSPAAPGGVGPGGEPPLDLVRRTFAVDHVPEQLTWLHAQGWDAGRVFPNGGWLMPWPTDPGEALEDLSFSIGTPFPWRRQMPLFHFDILLYTFVLAGEHAGEIWRYEISSDAWDSVRAAATSGVVAYREADQWLFIGDDVPDPFQLLLDRSPGLDPYAFPVSVPYPHWPLLRDRQRECGVDMDCIERGADCQFELLDAIDAARAALRSP